ncbi:hypothetical protein [Actinopolymorpha cephalotaxi]|uniref:PLL-like beta propeller domain-containing protein n=2 Tax=Actinopolymorpha cephalotaxi TaxID=504797 RepID=A0ABX2RZH1_9ACTN|nr:hypothetical protein [Actinopolymorpha cephalotaxi]NYH81359.1 hypothetical protein [Actinopolymorpha cephalotaxi]
MAMVDAVRRNRPRPGSRARVAGAAALLVAGALSLGATGAPAAAAGPAPAVRAPTPAAAIPLPSAERTSPAVTSYGPGRTDLFNTSSGGDLLQQIRYPGGSWTRTLNLGGDLASQPAAVSWAPGRMDVFARGTDNALWHRAYAAGGWQSWERLGGVLTSAPAVASQGPGLLDVFVRNVDNGLSHKAFASGSWSAWERLGGVLSSSPAATSWGPGRLDVFVRNADNTLSQKWFGDGRWRSWVRVGGATTLLNSQPAVASPGVGLLDVVARGSGNSMRLLRWTGSAWTSWASLGGTFSSGPTASDGDAAVRVVGWSSTGFQYESVRSTPAGTWSPWTAVDAYVAFRRLGTWVDTLDYATLEPVSSVADMRARDVRTLYLGTARFNSAQDFFDETRMGQWLDAAHAAGIRVVGWYVPGYGDLERDVRRTVAIGSYVSPAGQRFDAVGVDIERFGSDGEVTHAQFNQRLVTHLQQVRTRTPAVIGAIVPSPFGTDPGNRWEGFPWASIGPNSEAVVPMALWSFRSNFSAAQVYTWVKDQTTRARSLTGRRVHVEGGVIGEGSTPVTADRVQAFVNAVRDGGAVGGSQYDYATMTGHESLWPILDQLNN